MANHGPRLPDADIEIVRFTLSEEQWAALETNLRRTLSQSAREGLIEVCDSYFAWKSAEENAPTIKDLLVRLDRIGKDAGKLVATLGEALQGEAGRAVESLLSSELKGLPRRIGSKQIKVVVDPDQSASNAGKAVITVTQTATMIEDSVRDLLTAVTRSRQVLAAKAAEGHYNSLKPGRAFEDWCMSLRAWARSSRIPYSEHKAGSGSDPSPFSEFALALHGCLPERFQVGIRKADTMAERFKEYRAKRKQGKNRGK